MKNIKLLLLILSFLSIRNVSFSQNFKFDDDSDNEMESMVLKNGNVVTYKSKLYRFDNYFYFTDLEDVNLKIKIDSVSNAINNFEMLVSNKMSYFLKQFANRSQTGIGLQVSGAVLSFALTFTNVNPAFFVAPSALSVAGFIVWATSYNYLRKYSIIAESKDFFEQ